MINLYTNQCILNLNLYTYVLCGLTSQNVVLVDILNIAPASCTISHWTYSTICPNLTKQCSSKFKAQKAQESGLPPYLQPYYQFQLNYWQLVGCLLVFVIQLANISLFGYNVITRSDSWIWNFLKYNL